jgi:plastocyanin
MKTNISPSQILKTTIKIIFIAGLVLSSGCSKSSSNNPTPGANEVFIQSFAFTPETITVTVNTTITWTNKDAVAHTVTSDIGVFDSGTINANATYSHQFTVAGTYNYHCTIHPSMLAKVVVQ